MGLLTPRAGGLRPEVAGGGHLVLCWGPLEIGSATGTQSVQAQPPRLRLRTCRPPVPPDPSPVSELESALQMEPAAFRAAYSAEKPKLEDENLIFFCQMGKRGSQATQLARSLGYRGYGAGAPQAGEQLATARPAQPCPHACLHRARNYAGAYKEWFQKRGFHPPEPT